MRRLNYTNVELYLFPYAMKVLDLFESRFSKESYEKIKSKTIDGIVFFDFRDVVNDHIQYKVDSVKSENDEYWIE